MWLAEGGVRNTPLSHNVCVCVSESVWGTQLSSGVKSSLVSAFLELTLVWISRRWCHSLSSGPDARTKPSSVSTETCQTSKQSAVQLCMCVGGFSGVHLALVRSANELSRQHLTGLPEVGYRLICCFLGYLWETIILLSNISCAILVL